jgi:hypothetical protein
MKTRNIFTYIVLCLFALNIVSCGSSSSTSSTDDDTTAEETNAESVAQSTVTDAINLSPLVTSGSGSNLMYLPISIGCDSGTMTYDIDSVNETIEIIADECVTSFCSDSTCSTNTSITTDGTFSGTLSSSTATLVYDEYSVVTDVDGTETTNFTMDGTMTIAYDSSTNDMTITYVEFTGTDGTSTDTYAVDGSLTYNTSTTLIDGTITITSTQTISCVFSSFNYVTASATDWAAACTVL